MTENISKPSLDDIKSALVKSGYLLEQRICQPIASKGYTLYPNDQYEDDETGKSREIDLVAEKTYIIQGSKTVIISSHLVIEAKTNSYPVVLFLNEKGFSDPWIPYVNYPTSIKFTSKTADRHTEISGKGPFAFYLGVFGFNEIFSNYKAAFQYGLLKPEKSRNNTAVQWSVKHEDLYDSFTGIVKAMHFHKRACYNTALRFAKHYKRNELIVCDFIYPLVIFSGDIFTCKVDHHKQLHIEKEKDVFLYKRHTSKTIQDVFPLFTIAESDLNAFLKKVEINLEAAIKTTTDFYLNGKATVKALKTGDDDLDAILSERDTGAAVHVALPRRKSAKT